MKLEIDGFMLVGETYGEFFDKPELETAPVAIELLAIAIVLVLLLDFRR